MKTTSRVFIVFLPSPPAGFDNYNPIYMKINNLQRKIPKEFSPPVRTMKYYFHDAELSSPQHLDAWNGYQ